MDVETTQSDLFFRLMAWLHANRKRILIGAIAIAVIALVIGLFSWRKAAEDANANAHFFAIPGVVGISARAEVVSPTPLLNVAQEYPETTAGAYGLLLGAEELFMQAKYPEAQQDFAKFLAQYPDSQLVPEARLGVAASIEAQGNIKEAVQKYQELVNAFPGETHISSPARLTLARLYEQENQPQLALGLYSQLAQSQNPYDPWAAEARERGQLLLAKHPELRKAEASPGPTATTAPFSLSQPAASSSAIAPAKAPSAAKPAPASAKSGPNFLQIPSPSSNSTPKK
ncbi:MAG: tetratricopeptide repeat protein [Limisphaerales bacterium]